MGLFLGEDLRMNWERLKVFHQVVRAGSFTNAAFQMNISQSSLSRTIMQLEHELKSRLFHRLPHGLEPTSQGKNLYTVTTRMFCEAEAVENLFTQEKNEPAGLLRIITTISLASMWFPYYTLGFYEKYPDMRLIITGNDDNLDLNLRQADVSIRTFIPHKTTLANFCAIEHHRPYANQAVVTHRATVQHGLVTHRHPFANGQGHAHVGVQHAQVLNVGLGPNPNRRGIATHHHPKPDAHLFTQHHITHHLCTARHPGRLGNFWADALHLVNCHCRLSKPRCLEL